MMVNFLPYRSIIFDIQIDPLTDHRQGEIFPYAKSWGAFLNAGLVFRPVLEEYRRYFWR